MFDTIGSLKRHVRATHGPKSRTELPHTCLRCNAGFTEQRQLDDHLLRPPQEMCTTMQKQANPDPEDGISIQVDGVLSDRKQVGRLTTWENIYGLLFPNEAVPSSAFLPPIEIDELQLFLPTGVGQLHERVRSLVPSTHATGESQSSTTDSVIRVFMDYIDSRLASCRQHHRQAQPNKALILSDGPGLLGQSLEKAALRPRLNSSTAWHRSFQGRLDRVVPLSTSLKQTIDPVIVSSTDSHIATTRREEDQVEAVTEPESLSFSTPWYSDPLQEGSALSGYPPGITSPSLNVVENTPITRDEVITVPESCDGFLDGGYGFPWQLG